MEICWERADLSAFRLCYFTLCRLDYLCSFSVFRIASEVGSGSVFVCLLLLFVFCCCFFCFVFFFFVVVFCVFFCCCCLFLFFVVVFFCVFFVLFCFLFVLFLHNQTLRGTF